jgi:hypothetical protein
MISVDCGGGLTVEDREPPVAVAVCDRAFFGA